MTFPSLFLVKVSPATEQFIVLLQAHGEVSVLCMQHTRPRMTPTQTAKRVSRLEMNTVTRDAYQKD